MISRPGLGSRDIFGEKKIKIKRKKKHFYTCLSNGYLTVHGVVSLNFDSCNSQVQFCYCSLKTSNAGAFSYLAAFWCFDEEASCLLCLLQEQRADVLAERKIPGRNTGWKNT